MKQMSENRPRNATVRDVANEAGVSAMTVTRVMRGDTLVSDNTRKLVMQAAEKLNFTPNIYAKGLRGASVMSMGIMMTNPFGSELVRMISLSLMKSNYITFLADSMGDMEIVKSGLTDFLSRRVSALILHWRDYYREDAKLMSMLKQFNNVILYSNEQCEDLAYDTCLLDYTPACMEAVGSLWKSGRRRFMYLGRNDQWKTHDCLKAFKTQGLSPDRCLIETSVYPSEPAAGNYFKALGKWLSEGNSADAIFTANAVCAAQACAALKAHGLRVPEDTAVVGLDDNEMAPFCNPPIASVNTNPELVAEEIHSLLMNRMNNPDSKLRRKKINCSYMLRKSAESEKPSSKNKIIEKIKINRRSINEV